MEAVGGIDGQDKLSSQELQLLQELSKLDNNQLKDKIGEDNLSSFKSVLEAEKDAYLTRVNKKYEYGKDWTKEQANTYVPSLIDSIISKLGVNSNIKDINVDKQKKEIPKSDKIIEDETGDKKSGDVSIKEPIKKDKKIDDTKESNEKLESTIWDYFDIPNTEGEALKAQLEQHGLDLDIVPFLTTYKNHIESNLVGKLDASIVKQITDSIGIRVLHLSKIIDERIAFVDEQIEEGDYKVDKTKLGYETIAQVRATEIKNERWIINSKLQDSFSFVDNELLPSAAMLLKYGKDYGNKHISERDESLYNISDKLEEINKMFNSELLDNGDFDKTWRSGELIDANTNTWNIFDNSMTSATLTNKGIDGDLLKLNRINIIEGASLLDKNDKIIEQKAMMYFMAAIAVQVGGEIIGGPVGMAVGTGIDIHDTFSDTETLLNIVQGLGLVDSNYRMEKTWVDNILAGIGLIPGATQIIKGKKLAEWYSKLGKTEKLEFTNAISVIKDNKKVVGKLGKDISSNGFKQTDKIQDSSINFIKLDKEGQKKFLTEIEQELSLKIKNLTGSEKREIRDEMIMIMAMNSNLDRGEDLFYNFSKKQVNLFNEKYLGKTILKETSNINKSDDILQVTNKVTEVKGSSAEIILKDGNKIKVGNEIFIIEKGFSDGVFLLKNDKNIYSIREGNNGINSIGGYKIQLNGDKIIFEKLKTANNIDYSGLNIKAIGYSEVISDINKISDLLSDTLLKASFNQMIMKPFENLKQYKNIPKQLLKNLIQNIDNFILLMKNKGENITSNLLNKLDNIKDFIKTKIELPKIKAFNENLNNKEVGDIINIKTGNSEYVFEKIENGEYKLVGGNNEALIKPILNNTGKLYITEYGNIAFNGLSTSKVKGIEKIDNLNKSNKADGISKENINKVEKEDINLNYIDNLLENFDNIPKSEHAKELLAKYPELKPVGGIEIDGQKFLFSSIQNSGYKEVVGFVEIDGKLETRFFYKSHSDGGWRATPGQRYDRAYSKGENIKGHSYTITTKPNIEIDNYLNSLPEIKKNNDLLEDFGIFDEENGLIFTRNAKPFKKETKLCDDKGKLDSFREKGNPGYLLADFKNKSFNEIKDYFRNLDNTFPEGFIPNFSDGPIKVFETEHTIAGKTKVEVFEGTLNGKKVEWYMSQSIKNPEQIWISNIRSSNSKINSFGVDSEFINSGILTNKPFEYRSQLPYSLQIKGKGVSGNKYYDITEILGELKPIKEYKKYLMSKNTAEAA